MPHERHKERDREQLQYRRGMASHALPPTRSLLGSPRASPRGWYRPPPRTQRPRTYAAPPAIPIPSQAWGYEEGEHGSLVLAAPEEPAGEPRGPGAYTPTDATMRSAPHVDFSLSAARQILLPPTPHEGGGLPPPECRVSVPRRPLPLAAIAQLSPRRHWPAQLAQQPSPPPTPGPDAFETRLFRSRPCGTYPQQSRHFARLLALPLPPLSRGVSPRLVIDDVLGATQTTLGTPSPALNRRFMQYPKYDFFGTGASGTD
jgi:hypothetical protein